VKIEKEGRREETTPTIKKKKKKQKKKKKKCYKTGVKIQRKKK